MECQICGNTVYYSPQQKDRKFLIEVGNVESRERKNAFKILITKPQGKNPIER